MELHLCRKGKTSTRRGKGIPVFLPPLLCIKHWRVIIGKPDQRMKEPGQDMGQELLSTLENDFFLINQTSNT